MDKKHIRASVEFVLIHNDDIKINEKDIKEIGKGRIKTVKNITIDRIEKVSKKLKAYLKRRSKGKSFFAVEKNTTPLSTELDSKGFYDSFANYKFDSIQMKFQEIHGCDMLRYINKPSNIKIADIDLPPNKSYNQYEFYDDYKALWDMYRKQKEQWKGLCYTLKEYATKNDTIATFIRRETRDKNSKPQKYNYIVPAACTKSAENIIQYLKAHNILEEKARTEAHTTDSCKVVIVDRYGYKEQYDKLFSNIYALMLPDAISFDTNEKSNEINVVFDNLVVNGVHLDRNQFGNLLKDFETKLYISNLTISPDGKASFTYATRKIKELLTTPEKILEIYAYHDIKKTGKFDDVVSGLVIDFENTKVRFDCVLTKGFCTYFVKCNIQSDNELELLAKVAEKYGINPHIKPIYDTEEYHPLNNGNKKVVLLKQEEIDNIGKKMLKGIE